MVSLGFINNPPNGAFKRLRLLGQKRQGAVVLGGSPQILDISGGTDDGVAVTIGAYLTLFENGAIGGLASTTHALPDGTHTNQLKLLRHTAAGVGTNTVTITSNKLKGGTQLVLSINGLTANNVILGVSALLKWSGAQWVLVDQSHTTQVTIA